MSNFSDLIPLIMENKLNQAKEVLNQRLYSKLGVMLESRLEEYAPTVFMNEEELAIYEEKKKKNVKPDFLDLDKDGNKTEPMKSAANENYDSNEDDNGEELTEEALFEEFVDELEAIVEEIEQELGEELTEEEIQEIAEELLSEKECGMEDDSEDDSEDDDMEEEPKKKKKDKE